MIINNPSTWAELLQFCPKNSILAGGAIRDWLVGQEPKDYDIFYSYFPGIPITNNNWLYQEIVDPVAHAAEYQPVDGEPNKKIGAVYNYEVILSGGFFVQVQMVGVHYPNPKEHCKTFDHTLTLGRFGLESGLAISPLLFESLRTRTVTCLDPLRKEKSFLRATTAVERIDPDHIDLWTYKNFN
jgi:hypothetical protein